MNCFCGIDLGAKRSQACVINDNQKVLVDRKVANDLEVIHGLIQQVEQMLSTLMDCEVTSVTPAIRRLEAKV